MKRKSWLLALLAALVLLTACASTEETGPKLSDLTPKEPASAQETAEPAAEPEPEVTEPEPAEQKKGGKDKSGQKTEEETEPESHEALLAAYEAILDRSVEILLSGGDIATGDGEMGLLEAAYQGGSGVGYAIEDLSGDGVPELILGSADGSTIYALYAGDGSEPVLLLEGWYRNCWQYLGNGRFYNSGSAGAAYTMAGTFALSRDGLELVCEDFYFTYELDENFEEFGFFHNTSGLWDTSVSEQLDMTYDDLWELEQDWEAQALYLDLTPLEVPISGPQVRVMWADEEWNGDYERVDVSSGESSATVLFVADSPVVDFRILSLLLEDVAEDGTMTFSSSDLCCVDVLTPDCALAADVTFYGDLPNCGISYIDQNGTFWQFTLTISGEDGSLVLTEF